MANNRRSLKSAIESDTELSSFVFGQNFSPSEQPEVLQQTAPLSAIHRTSLQKRRYFDPQELKEWAETEVRANGIRSPLWVRPLPEGKAGEYELVAGERRYRAAEILELDEVPVRVFQLDNKQALMASLIENMQRRDLNPLEETEGTLEVLAMELECSTDEVTSLLYQMNNASKGTVNQNVLVSPASQKVEMVFKFLGQLSWKSFVSSRLPLLKKPQDILDALRSGQIEYTKAMEIARVKDESQRQTLLQKAIADDLSLSEIRVQARIQSAEPDLPSPKAKVTAVYRQVLKTKLWEKNPKKWKQAQALLDKLEALISEE